MSDICQETSKPDNTKDTGRNPDGTWKKGFCPNPGGRHKNPLKEFSLAEFNSWTNKQKQEFLKKISPFDRWRMTEGNPKQDTEISGNPDLPFIFRIEKIEKDDGTKGSNSEDVSGTI